MTVESPFQVAVYDKAMKRLGWVGDPVELTVTPRHNMQPTASITVKSDSPRVPALAAAGARVTIKYDGSLILSGQVRLRQGRGPRSVGTVTFQVVDDWRVFTRVQGWPIPGSALTSQGPANLTDRRGGNAETVLRGYVQANAITRLGLPVTFGSANLNRGTDVRLFSRFHPLADVLFPAIDNAGIGVNVRQAGPDAQGTGLRVDVYTPRVYPRTLTEASGVVKEWEWSQADPDVTRQVGTASGADTLRSYRQTIDAAREAEYGDLIEGFLEAGDVKTDEAAWEGELDARIAEALAEGAPRAGLSVKLAETSAFRYDPTGLAGVRVGDRVRLEVGPGVVVEDVLREATLSWTAAEGLLVTPQVGDRRDDPNRALVRAVASLARSFRDSVRR